MITCPHRPSWESALTNFYLSTLYFRDLGVILISLTSTGSKVCIPPISGQINCYRGDLRDDEAGAGQMLCLLGWRLLVIWEGFIPMELQISIYCNISLLPTSIFDNSCLLTNQLPPCLQPRLPLVGLCSRTTARRRIGAEWREDCQPRTFEVDNWECKDISEVNIQSGNVDRFQLSEGSHIFFSIASSNRERWAASC